MPTESDEPDYYTLLGVSTDATASAIKAAFKRLALRYHPDVYHGDDAEERMRELLRAYRTLSDPATRLAYDAQRSGTEVPGAERPHGQAPNTGRPQATGAVSPGARRDRHRPYAFPDLRADTPARFVLGGVSYDLSAEEANTLRQQGFLRGIAREATGVLSREVWASLPHFCHRCHYRWIPAEVDAGPARLWELICPACRANDWGEYLLLRCVHCRAIFESEQIRDPLGLAGKRLCPPYELFPLCPYCGAARWCPAEDARVEALRYRAGRKRAGFKRRS